MKNDIQQQAQSYTEKYQKYGYSEQALDMTKPGKQDIRFSILTSLYDFAGKTVLDIGCGFGDINKVLRKFGKYRYIGYDIVKDFVDVGNDMYGDGDSIKLIYDDFSSAQVDEKVDYAIACGPFNYVLREADNYEYVSVIMTKAFNLARDGVAFDFLSSTANIRHDGNYYYEADKVLSIALNLTKNVVLRHDYFPFEFSVFLNKDDGFVAENTIFNHFLANQVNDIVKEKG